MTNGFTRLSSFFNYATALYHNDQYLLMVDRSFNVETYRRIYFKDLQSVQVQKTAAWLWRSILSGLAAGISLLIALFIMSDSGDNEATMGFKIILLLSCAGFGIYMIMTLIRGSSCKVYVCTAVQRIFLPNVNTIRRLNRFSNVITPFLSTIQGELSKDDLKENLAESWENIRAEKETPKVRITKKNKLAEDFDKEPDDLQLKSKEEDEADNEPNLEPLTDSAPSSDDKQVEHKQVIHLQEPQENGVTQLPPAPPLEVRDVPGS